MVWYDIRYDMIWQSRRPGGKSRFQGDMLCSSLTLKMRDVEHIACRSAYRGRVWGVQPPPPPPKLRRPSKIVPNSTRLWKLLKIAEFRTSTPQDVRGKGSKILKQPPVRNCFTLAMTNKLVVVINSLKVPKIKKILQYEMKFLVPLTRGLTPPDPRSLCHLSSTEFVEPSPNKIPGYATDIYIYIYIISTSCCVVELMGY